ncbi:hypothetical protein NQZ79_g3957 [Umbelopsis isabellina]|nr:hypothetical protein NQZ79_g3957 [Umbelopsis isabellina]
MKEASTSKRKHSDEPPESPPSKKLAVEEPDVLSQLTTILDQITSCSTEIPALYLSTLKSLMQQIEGDCADESNTKAREVMEQSERFLEEWFENLVDRYGADEEFIFDESADEEDQLAIALALADEDEEDEEVDIDSIHNSPTENSPNQPVLA